MTSHSSILLIAYTPHFRFCMVHSRSMVDHLPSLRNMRVLKFHGWEMRFLSKIFRLRKVETLWLTKYLCSSVCMNFVFGVATTFVALVTFGSCIFMGIPLETGKILSSLATFRVLERPIYLLPAIISKMIQAKVSVGRIALFLSRDELARKPVEQFPLGNPDIAIQIDDADFSWDLSSPNPTLKNINLNVYHGMKVAICGKVGSGKSSLLCSILGEIPKMSGVVKLSGGRKAYVAQTPWIQSCTIQDNIVIGKEIDSVKYDRVLEACCLKKDLEVLSFGDRTVVGERGVNLSGGQKQRIQIARAVYHDADIYLFDDPFSAVDAHTASHLYQEVLMGLLRAKTVVYVTHQVEFLSEADLVLVMKDGRIVQAGKYNDILIPDSNFSELVGIEEEAVRSRPVSTVVVGEDYETRVEVGDSGKVVQTSVPPAPIIQEEERETGSVGISVYWTYITTAYGGRMALVTSVCLIFCEILQIGSNFWLAWATPMSKDVKPLVTTYTLMTVYLCLALGVSLTTLVSDILVASIGYITGNTLFRKMHECILRAPMSFFDATPSGRILNRCSSDQSLSEDQIPTFIRVVAMAIILLTGILAVMAVVAWQVLIISVPIVFVCIWYQTLDTCQLGDQVRKMERKLDSEVVENGENWSTGQRQLVCVGRVLLKKSKILVLDEATASVDTNTDYLIQQTLKKHFSHCTIITIAHRMASVLDTDMVLLLNNGLIEEFDSPRKLLGNKTSSFSKLVEAWSSSHSKKSGY